MGKTPAGGHLGLFLEQVPPFPGHHLDGAAGILTVGADEDLKETGPEELSQERQGPKIHSALPGWHEQEWVEQSSWQEVGWGVVLSFRTVGSSLMAGLQQKVEDPAPQGTEWQEQGGW